MSLFSCQIDGSVMAWASFVPMVWAWPITLLLAWFAGELAYHAVGLPRVSTYGITGFLLAFSQLGFLPHDAQNQVLLLANMAFGLILFEAGYRINLRWLYANPWLGGTTLLEVLLTGSAVYFLLKVWGMSSLWAGLLATLAIATSPATVVRILNEQQSAGQVTERILHLSVFNCVFAVGLFKMLVSVLLFKLSGHLGIVFYNSFVWLVISVSLGIAFGTIVPGLLRMTRRMQQDSTLAFAMAVILLVALTHGLRLSPILATLTFGLVTRHRRIVLSASQRNFGTLGDILSVLLFVFIATTLEWSKIKEGFALGMAVISVRALTKLIGISALARLSGISWRKGFLVSMGMMPLSVFVILIVEQQRYLGIHLFDQLAPLAAAAFIMEILGPVLTQTALRWSQEVKT